MSNEAAFTINGTPSVSVAGDRIFRAALNQQLTLQLEDDLDLDHVESVTYEVDTVRSSQSAPAIVFDQSGTAQVTPIDPSNAVTIVMPGVGVHSYLFRATVRLVARDARIDNQLQSNIYERVVSIETGTVPALRKLVQSESTEAEAKGPNWNFNRVVDYVISLVVGGGLTSSAIVNASSAIGATVTAALNYLLALINAVSMTVATKIGYSDLTTISATQHIYMDSVAGNDSNSGTSSGQALATVVGLYAKFPRLRTGPVVIHLASGNYPNLRLPPTVAMNPLCAVYVIGDTSSPVTTGTVTAGSTDLVLNTTVASKDLYAGFTIRFTTGALANGQKRTLRNCTTTTIIPACRFTTSPANGDAYAIERPNAIITYTDACTLAEGIGNGHLDSPLVLVNIGSQGPNRGTATPACVIRIVRCTVLMFGVVTQNGGSFQLVDSTCYAGTLYAWGSNQQIRPFNVPPLGNGTATTFHTLALADLGVADPFLYAGWGVSSPMPATALQGTPLLFQTSRFNGYVCANYLPVTAGSFVQLIGGGLVTSPVGGSQLNLEAGAYVAILPTTTQRTQLSGGGGQNAPGNEFWIDTNAIAIRAMPGSFLELHQCTCTSSGSSISAVFLQGANVYMSNSISSGLLTILLSGTGSNGLQAWRGTRIVSEGGSILCTYLGAISNALDISSGTQVYGLDSLSTNGDLIFGTTVKVCGLQGGTVAWTARALSTQGFVEFDFSQSGNGTITLNPNVTGELGTAGSMLNLKYGSKLFTANLTYVLRGVATLEDGAEWHLTGALGASTWAASAIPLRIQPSCKFSCYKAVSGTLTITCTGAPAESVTCQGEMYFINGRFACSGATSGINFSRGGRVYCDTQPTNIVGTTNDFIDEQGGFSDAQLATAIGIFTGQHPAGTYSSVTTPTGTGFVQRVS